jgi:hypothetical protein
MSDLIIPISSLPNSLQTPVVSGDSRDDVQQVVRIAQPLANTRCAGPPLFSRWTDQLPSRRQRTHCQPHRPAIAGARARQAGHQHYALGRDRVEAGEFLAPIVTPPRLPGITIISSLRRLAAGGAAA